MTKERGQCEMLLDYIREHEEGITSKDAFELFGITRLSGRIFDLRERGHEILNFKESGPNRFGKTARWVRYVYAGERV
ncbi:MAG: helix-turn-helix domain-containing protein [Lachnospiraceae bacterium]|nr:helix-turn-helix domain-containing protein [Lachnospiraceae bacterium]